MMAELSTTQELHAHNYAAATFNALIFRDGLPQLRRAAFAATELTLDKLTLFGEVQLAEQSADEAAVVLRPQPEMLIYLHARRGHGEIAVAGIDRGAVDRVTTEVIASLRDPDPPDDQMPVAFWRCSAGRPLSSRRRIQAASWQEVHANYSAATRAQLEHLMTATEGGPGGGLILWHGEPGTGKSYALRALAREWRAWSDTHVITDADAFLGAGSNYLMDTLLRNRDDRWRLIVLEDAGELLTADARAIAGQALSRLLNTTDGLLGAGLRATVLVTTNEPLGRLHPAVVRPGRAWAQVEFSTLSVDEAESWLADRDREACVQRPATIAELFAIAGGRVLAARSAGLGFAA